MENKTETHYQERESLFPDGSIIIFRRGDAVSEGEKRIWNARFKIKGWKGYKFVSLKTRNKELAKQAAHQEWARLSQTVAAGGSLKNLTFSQAWLKFYDDMIQRNRWSVSRKKWYLNYYNRYFSAYFADKKLDELSDDFARGYWSWRRRYWNDGGDGEKQIAYNRRRKRAKSYSSFNVKKDVSFTTLRMEQSALNFFFNWCYSTKRLMKYPIRMKVDAGNDEKNEGRRPSFDNEEWRALTRNLLSWAEGKGKYSDDRLNAFHRHQRQQLRYYVLFLSSTGIRSGTETRFMKWEDVKEIDINREEASEKILDIRIRATGKTRKTRHVMSQSSCVKWMKEWKEISHYPGNQDFVWYGQSKEGEPQKVATDLNKTFQAFLRTVDFRGRKDGLLNDVEGNRRSLYSLRHFYAEQRIINGGVSYEFLRKNMGTGIQQLIKHYEQTTTKQHAAEITKVKWKRKGSLNSVDQILSTITPQQKAELLNKLKEMS